MSCSDVLPDVQIYSCMTQFLSRELALLWNELDAASMEYAKTFEEWRGIELCRFRYSEAPFHLLPELRNKISSIASNRVEIYAAIDELAHVLVALGYDIGDAYRMRIYWPNLDLDEYSMHNRSLLDKPNPEFPFPWCLSGLEQLQHIDYEKKM